MIMDDNDVQMIFGDRRGLKLPDICLTGEEKPQKKPHPGSFFKYIAQPENIVSSVGSIVLLAYTKPF